MVEIARYGVSKKVMIADLKARLSAHIRQVEKGAEIIVLDRKRPVAKIIPYHEPKKETGLIIHKATRPIGDFDKLTFVKPKVEFDVVETLMEMRKDRKFW